MTKGRTFLILGCAALLIAASDRADAREPDQVTKAALTGHRPHAGDAPQFLGKGPIVVNGGHSGLTGIDSLVNFTGLSTRCGPSNQISYALRAGIAASPRTVTCFA